MKKVEKKPYEAPQLTVVSFKAERGYADSSKSRFISLVALSSLSSGSINNQFLDDRGTASQWTW